MRKVFELFDSITKYILFLLLTSMLVSAFLQVIFRSVLSISVSWTDELTRYLFIWLIFLGIAFSIRRSGHISIDTIYLFMKSANKIMYKKIIYVIQLVFFIVVFFYGTNFMINNFMNTSPSLGLPMGIIYLSLPFGCVLCCIFLIEKLFFEREEVLE